MAARKESVLVTQQKRQLVSNAIRDRASASSTSLSASFGLPVEDVRRILSAAKVNDDG